jgi:monomeric sarcosine oxidase
MARAPRIIVIGGGTMGLASAAALARRGAEVVVLERFGVLHDQGSHGGYTRVTRQAYHEGSPYVPLVRESEAEWERLEAIYGEQVLVRAGLVEVGDPEDADMRAVLAACREHAIEHIIDDAATIGRRHGILTPAHWIACTTPSGGFVRVRAAFEAMRREAEARGAVIRGDAPVRELILGGERPRVLLESGEILAGDHLVVAAGAWIRALVPAPMRRAFTVRRRVLAWTSPAEAERPRLAAMPVWASFEREGMFYGFPCGDHGVRGFKLACHVYAQAGDAAELEPGAVDRQVHPADLAPLAEFLATRMPHAAGPWAASSICLYTCTPRGDFLVDLHPEDPRVILAAGFSGHGFKFAPTIGRLVADLIADPARAAVPAIFRWSRLCADAGL